MVLQIKIIENTRPTKLVNTLTAANNGCFKMVNTDERIRTIAKAML